MRNKKGQFVKGNIPWSKDKFLSEERKMRMRKHSLNQEYFNQQLDNERAYWIGLLMADGCVHKNKLLLRLKDKNHIIKFKSALNYGGSVGWRKNNNWSIQLQSKKLTDSLAKFGIVPNKTFKTHVPFDQIPENLLRHFFRGLIDGDGTIGKNKNGWYLGLAGTENITKAFLGWTQKQTKNKKGIVYRQENIWKVRFGGNVTAWTIAWLLYKNVPLKIRLERKYQKYLEFKKWREKKLRICPYCKEKFYPIDRGQKQKTCQALVCRAKRDREWHKQHWQIYFQQNRVKILERGRQRYQKHKEEINKRRRELYNKKRGDKKFAS